MEMLPVVESVLMKRVFRIGGGISLLLLASAVFSLLAMLLLSGAALPGPAEAPFTGFPLLGIAPPP